MSHWIVRSPFHRRIVAEIQGIQKEQLLDKIESSYQCFERFRRTDNRKQLLSRLHTLIAEHKSELAAIMAQESGKPISQALGEIDYANSFVDYYSKISINGTILESNIPDATMMTVQEPVGVALLITPWNFPLAMITRKLAPAIAAGCTTLIKPSPETPGTLLKLMELIKKAGFPEHSVQELLISQADTPEFGLLLAQDPRISKISFTGSTQVGKWLHEKSSSTLKRLSFELGGNAPFVVFEDADLEKASQGLIDAKYRFSGQTCVCPNRVYVHSRVLDKFVALLTLKLKKLKLGDPMDPLTQIGPVINEKGLEKIQRHLQDALDKGAKLVYGGGHEGLVVQPTILTGCTPEMLIFQEETFGPVAGIAAFDDDEQVLQACNSTRYGLASYFFTKSLQRIKHFSRFMDSGMVGVNTGLISSAVAPFGGIKESGKGREGSRLGIDEYLETKYICIKA
ncbi:succinate-semialdehyde dehydrogenase [Gorgonomyces haynaldii]|nr:succinate-semialdehyde dehydrogenase [Gorgonomyces haynaldii]